MDRLSAPTRLTGDPAAAADDDDTKEKVVAEAVLSVSSSGWTQCTRLRFTKRHAALSYHCVREAIATGLIKFGHVPGEANVADILSKHWGYSKIWSTSKKRFRGQYPPLAPVAYDEKT